MKKLILLIVLICTSCATSQEAQLTKEIEEAEKHLYVLKQDLITHSRDLSVADSLVETNGTIPENRRKYLILVQFKDKGPDITTLSVITSSPNRLMPNMYLPIEVSKEFYYSNKVGDVLTNKLRVGTYTLLGNTGRWEATVAEKHVVPILQ